jgi:predicted MFS family arabinose efflux permease
VKVNNSLYGNTGARYDRCVTDSDPSRVSPRQAVVVGLVSLAAAMGIGRFAFTPLWPLMQGETGLSLTQGAGLASANYLGYLVGAVALFLLAVRAPIAARVGLVAVAGTTLAGSVIHSLAAWIVVRFAAGVASALVLIGASAWTLRSLAHHQRTHWSGWAFAGVGVGICLAGLTALAVAWIGVATRWAWTALGVLAAAAAAWTWRPLASSERSAPASAAGGRLSVAGWILIGCYGVFGYGYILPATFIPAAARAIVASPTGFAWVWPLFGLAAAVSTALVSCLRSSDRPRLIAGASFIVMALGVLLAAIGSRLETLYLAAICVGATCMVATMACLQEARRIGREAPDRLIAAMTAAFAVGQLLGPLTLRGGDSLRHAIAGPSALAGALLLLAGVVLLVPSSQSRPAPAALPHPGRCK